MVHCNKNKNELLALTGAVYTFVAYLTAFTLEILFIIDLAKRYEGLNPAATTTASTYNEDLTQTSPLEQARLTFESMQAHVTISCLAISILYFVLFIASLILIIALILRSTFFILIWMCIMTTMYLPEFGLIIYVSIYGWGLNTRNGQTELIFYLFRAALNVIFIFRAHRLLKDWSYEKNFFMLKSSSRYTGYDSPYFIGDSLTTTINPVFSSSTLNLDRYDQVRDINTSSTVNNAFNEYDFHYDRSNKSSLFLRDEADSTGRKFRNSNFGIIDSVMGRKAGFYLPNDGYRETKDQKSKNINRLHARQNSVLSINDNDDYADFEMDLDYRTLTHQRHFIQQNDSSTGNQGNRLGVLDNSNSIYNTNTGHNNGSSTRSPGGLSYSTQSLDRRHLRDMDFSLPEHVILRPLGHQPFEYLQRPGSTSNLNSSNNLNTQPSSYSSNTILAKRSGLNMKEHDRFA